MKGSRVQFPYLALLPALSASSPLQQTMLNSKVMNRLNQQFSYLEDRTFNEIMKEPDADHPTFLKENIDKNRYLTLSPARETLITDPVYLNGNFISIDDVRYIAT